MEFKEGDIIKVTDWRQQSFVRPIEWFECNLNDLKFDWLVRFSYGGYVKDDDKRNLFRVLYVNRDCSNTQILLITSMNSEEFSHTYLMDEYGCELIERRIESSSATVLPAKAQIKRNGKIINFEGTMNFSTGELHLTEKKGE